MVSCFPLSLYFFGPLRLKLPERVTLTILVFSDRAHSILLHVLPLMGASWAIIRFIYITWLHPEAPSMFTFDDLPFLCQLLLTAALGAFLMTAFSLAHSVFAIALAPLKPHPLSYFPPLYTSRVWEITSVRNFWSHGWHRLFSRLFLVYGVWPGEWVERRIARRRTDESADIGKLIGGFICSALVHSFAAYTVLGGILADSLGEAKFFTGCGIAVVLETNLELIIRGRRRAQKQRSQSDQDLELSRWYDGVVGRIWWISVLLYNGRHFARGWVKAGLVREMAGM